MAKRRMAVIVVLMCVCVWLIPPYAMAASTTDAVEPIDVNQECSLTLSYAHDGTVVADAAVKLYQIAEVSADFQYAAVEPFGSYGLALNGIKSNDEWNVVRSTLEAHITADKIAPDQTAKTDSEGLVCFKALKPGLYLAVVGVTEQPFFFDSALVSLPSLGADGMWQYQVEVASKAEILPPSVQEKERKILKLWKGDEGKGNRPQSIEVELFRDGTSYKKVLLSQENNWSYRWTAKEDGTKWSVIERTIPSGYTMTVEERGDTFVLTNTYTPKNPDPPSKSPQTGDSFNVMFYVLLMILSGSMLMILGIIGKRNAHEKTK